MSADVGVAAVNLLYVVDGCVSVSVLTSGVVRDPWQGVLFQERPHVRV